MQDARHVLKNYSVCLDVTLHLLVHVISSLVASSFKESIIFKENIFNDTLIREEECSSLTE